MRTFDVLVLGGGISGICAALHLQARGLSVLVVDRSPPGDQASQANAGIVGVDAHAPFDIPSSLADILGRIAHPSGRIRVDPRALVSLVPFFQAAKRFDAAGAATARALAPLQAAAVPEHLALARAASGLRFFRRTGWIKLYRRATTVEASEEERHLARVFGVPYAVLDDYDLHRLEPDLKTDVGTVISWSESQSVSSPGGVTKAYARLFRERGGQAETGDGTTLSRDRAGWTVRTAHGSARAQAVVMAAGVGGVEVLKRSGIRLPVAALRGYHRHFRAVQDVHLARPITDVDGGFTLTPMERGVRLVGGYELTRTDAPVRGDALQRATALARQLMPLGASVEEAAVPAVRVCVPDGLPILGAMPGYPGLWLSLAHARDGFGHAAALGRLLSELMMDDRPFLDPVPFAPTRFVSD